MSLFAVVLAGSDAPPPGDIAAPSDAEKSFQVIKTLAGEWEGPVTVVPSMPAMGDGQPLHVSLRVTSRGNAIVHEMQTANTPLDPTKYDHPITMLYLDGEKLNLTHYCDAGNRPHMLGGASADGKRVEFELVDISGSLKYGHMRHSAFTYIDSNHHTEDWTFIMPDDKEMHAHFDLHRVN